MNKTGYSTFSKRPYKEPSAEIVYFTQNNSLLRTFSSDIEIWEDDEIVMPEE